ncbi:hypothetical protein BJY04DRAFT_219271 [Aspergillus karnatakaensis]|uniref:uncharacterized protein n=1 Tax=Aspergillus karnatakaensis TaxID=1810916 RepID=UPI003CCDDC79
MALSLYTLLAVPLLTSWTLLALLFTALNVLNTDASYLSLITSTSLFTFLICRLLLVCQPSLNNNSLAHTLTTAYRSSARNAAIFLLLALSWLHDLLYKTLGLFFITIFGGGLATAIYNDAFHEVNEHGEPVAPVQREAELDIEPNALAAIDEFRDKTGANPLAIVKMIPPKLLVYLVVIVWVSFASLGVYILRLAFRAARGVFGAKPGEISRVGTEEKKKEKEKQRSEEVVVN